MRIILVTTVIHSTFSLLCPKHSDHLGSFYKPTAMPADWLAADYEDIWRHFDPRQAL